MLLFKGFGVKFISEEKVYKNNVNSEIVSVS